MGVDVKKILIGVRQIGAAAINSCFTSFSDHPFAWFFGCWAFFLYLFFPCLFHFLLSSAPVLVCTAVLLGTLLSFGQPNIPLIDDEYVEKDVVKTGSWNVSAVKSSPVVVADRVIGRDGGLSLERSQLVGSKSGSGSGDVGGIRNDNSVFEHGEDDLEGLIEIGIRSDALHGGGSSCMAEEINEIGRGNVVEKDGFLNASSWKQIGSDEESDSGSDEAESVSPDASMTDIMPMLDELHPLLDLDVDAPKPAPHSPGVTDEDEGEDDDDEDEDSDGSADDDDSDTGSEALDEEEEIRDEEEEDEEAYEDQEDIVASEVVTWNEDDEKNLKDMKKLELERNMKMESMIAKRLASRNQRAMAEINLIDLDGLHLQIPPVSTDKRNPFDVPDAADRNLELPSIPGSAPSVLHPRINPFHPPFDQLGNIGSNSKEESTSYQSSMTMPQREPIFRRHDTFHLGTSLPDVIMRETGHFKPYFVVEKVVPEDMSTPPYQRQMSDRSESKISSVNETDTNASDSEEEREEVSDDEPQTNFSSSSPYVQNVEQLNGERDFSDEDSFDSHEEHVEENVDAVDTTGDRVEDEVDSCQPEFLGENCEGRSSSSLSEESNESSSLEKAKDEPSNWSSDSVHSLIKEPAKLDVVTVIEPVYDSSPSALEKSLSNMTDIDEALFNPDHGDINYASSSMLNRFQPFQKVQINEPVYGGKLYSPEESDSDLKTLPRQDKEFSQDFSHEVDLPVTESSLANMESGGSQLTCDLVSLGDSAKGTEIFMEKIAGVDGLHGTDEYLLSELDAVGDFSVQRDSHITEVAGVYEESMRSSEPMKLESAASEDLLTDSLIQDDNAELVLPNVGWIKGNPMSDVLQEFGIMEDSEDKTSDNAVSKDDDAVKSVNFYNSYEKINAEPYEYDKNVEVLEAKSLSNIESLDELMAGESEKSIILGTVNESSVLPIAMQEISALGAASSIKENTTSMQLEKDNSTSSSIVLNHQIFEGEDALISSTHDANEREKNSGKPSNLNNQSDDFLHASSVDDVDSACMHGKDEAQNFQKNSAVLVKNHDVEVSCLTDDKIEYTGSSEVDLDGDGGASSLFEQNSTNMPSMSCSELNNCGNDMDVVEARSLEDIDLVFSKMRTDAVAKSLGQKPMDVGRNPELQLVGASPFADLSLPTQNIEREDASSSITNSKMEESAKSLAEPENLAELVLLGIQVIDKQHSDGMDIYSREEGTNYVLVENVVQRADNPKEEILPVVIESMPSDLHATKRGKKKLSSSSSSSSSSDSE